MNWLFLRGLVREQRHWNEFPRKFQAAFPHAKIHFLDLPGVGTEHQRLCPFSISQIQADIRERWLNLKASNEGPWSLFSISLGSMIAMDWVHTHPGDFERLVLINTSAANLDPPWQRLQFKQLPRAVKVLFAPTAFHRERRILSMTTSLFSASQIDEIASKWSHYYEDSPVKLGVTLAQLYSAATFRAPQSLPVKTLALVSAGDQFIHPSCGLHLAKHLDVPCEIHPTAGHDLPLEDGEWVCQKLKQWLV